MSLSRIEDAMVGDDEISEAGRKARFERWEQLGLDVIRTDLEATGGLLVSGPSLDDLAAAISSQRPAQTLPSTPPPQQQPEILTLKPGI
jgi:hypothetical protein